MLIYSGPTTARLRGVRDERVEVKIVDDREVESLRVVVVAQTDI